jgi:hypothetical protein
MSVVQLTVSVSAFGVPKVPIGWAGKARLVGATEVVAPALAGNRTINAIGNTASADRRNVRRMRAPSQRSRLRGSFGLGANRRLVL